MTIYDLYLESGPKKKKTMVHVIDLLGCVAVGPTTDEAIAATPDAIRAFKRVLHRHGDVVDPEASFETRVAEHVTEGEWLGNGSPYLTFERDLDHLSANDVASYLDRDEWFSAELAEWAAAQSDADLDKELDGPGRTARSILLHILGAKGNYLSAALGGAPGFGAVHGAAERGEISFPEAFERTVVLARDRVRDLTDEQRNAVRQLSSRDYTLRKAFRRMLEHEWEHLAELSRRPGGPTL